MKRRPFIKQIFQVSGGAWLGAQLPMLYGYSTRDKDKKLGIALVGLGNYASGQLAPALLETKYCYLAGIVTGTKAKESDWSKKYNIPEKNIYKPLKFLAQ